MTETSNDWCRVLGIDVPELAVLATHPDANSYALLLVALLERGEPMMLEDVADRACRNRERGRGARVLEAMPPGTRAGLWRRRHEVQRARLP